VLIAVKSSSVPSSFVRALECFITAKQEFVSQDTSAATSNLSTLYDYQHKYVSALIKQLPLGTVFPVVSRSVPMHPPNTIKSQPVRQGPFLLQPSPRTLEGSEGGDATDMAYMAFADDGEEDNEGETERLGIVIVTYQDGKADVYLDVEKVEARWESKQVGFRVVLWGMLILHFRKGATNFQCSLYMRRST
jgi:nucleoporin NUP82